jgi:hypothetical protein
LAPPWDRLSSLPQVANNFRNPRFAVRKPAPAPREAGSGNFVSTGGDEIAIGSDVMARNIEIWPIFERPRAGMAFAFHHGHVNPMRLCSCQAD